jgi:hypothetical protein
LLELLDCLGNIELTDAQDERSFRFGPSKKFSVKGRYYTLNYGGVLRQGNLEIWNSWAPKKCKIFAWLACWRRPPELEAQCRSAMSLSLTNERRRTRPHGHEESILPQPMRLLPTPSLLFLWCLQPNAIRFPRHARSRCVMPAFGTGTLFMCGVARTPLGRTVNAARFWPYTKCSCLMQLAKLGM